MQGARRISRNSRCRSATFRCCCCLRSCSDSLWPAGSVATAPLLCRSPRIGHRLIVADPARGVSQQGRVHVSGPVKRQVFFKGRRMSWSRRAYEHVRTREDRLCVCVCVCMNGTCVCMDGSSSSLPWPNQPRGSKCRVGFQAPKTNKVESIVVTQPASVGETLTRDCDRPCDNASRSPAPLRRCHCLAL